MNIFYLDKNPYFCAQYHVDKHCVKMILEYAQLLSTAHRVLDGQHTVVYKNGRKIQRWFFTDKREHELYSATHVNHPSAVWVRQSYKHYVWLYELFRYLLNEYTFRYGKTHKCAALLPVLFKVPSNIDNINFIDPPLAMPEDVKVTNDAIQSYRNYYIHYKKGFATWKTRNPPSWWINKEI